MAFALKLFSIQVHNTHQEADTRHDFHLTPDADAQSWMQRYRMRLSAHQGRHELIWLTMRLTDPLQVLRQKMYDQKLTFHLTLQNPHCIQYSVLSVERGKIYHFTNLGAPPKLHPQAYVTAADMVPLQPRTVHYDQVEKTHFGKIDIHLKQLCDSSSTLPIDYTIHIQARQPTEKSTQKNS